MEYAELMNTAFYVCVFILRWGAHHLGMTYEALNIWIFVIIHPALTVYFFVKWRLEKTAHYRHIQCLSILPRPKNTKNI